MTNDQKIAACLAILGRGVALDPQDKEEFNALVKSMEAKPAKGKADAKTNPAA